MSLLRTLRTLLRGYQLDDPCKQNIMKSLIWICRCGNIWSCYSQLLAEKNLLKTNCWMLALFFGPMPVNIIQIPRLPNKCCTYQNSTITTLNVFYIDMTHTNSVTSHTKSNQKHIKKTQCNIIDFIGDPGFPWTPRIASPSVTEKGAGATARSPSRGELVCRSTSDPPDLYQKYPKIIWWTWVMYASKQLHGNTKQTPNPNMNYLQNHHFPSFTHKWCPRTVETYQYNHFPSKGTWWTQFKGELRECQNRIKNPPANIGPKRVRSPSISNMYCCISPW